jgi:putative protease
MFKVELMSPVGSFEALAAAIDAGADAIYFGLGELNMRSASAANFSLDDLVTITTICKEHNVKSYLALNTIVFNNDIMPMKMILDLAKRYAVDAVIASDMAVIGYARKIGLNVHISTQCNVTNIEAVRFYSALANVMVTARELSIEQVAEIIKQIESEQIKGPSGELVRIEIFVHGALCMAVSGKCYLSLDNYNSSANRGKCLQLCRRPYKVTDLDGEVELAVDNEYIMSPKDLKTLDFLDDILKSGVSVLKIEGRGRSADYVSVVTKVYREAIDAVLNNSFDKDKLADWNERLATVYNRGFWNGYYLGQKTGEWTKQYGSLATRTKVYIGKVTNFFANISVAEIKIETGELNVGDTILVTGATTGVYEDTINEIRVDLQPVERADKGKFCSIHTNQLLRRGDKVYVWNK